MINAPNQFNFLRGGGEMGKLTRDFDWAKTTLGKPEHWPLSLRTTVGILLHSSFPMFLFWGKELLCFYNDAYRPSLGIEGKHPLIGQKAQEAWPEIWDFIHPIIEKVMETETASWYEDQLLPIYRNGRMEDVYWTFSYSPAYDDDDQVAGVFVTCTETTEKVKATGSLQEHKDRLQFAIDAADLGTWELNPYTNTFRGNDRLKKWFGLTPDDEIALSLATSVIAERDREKVNAAIRHALTYGSGGLYEIEYTIQNPLTGLETIVKAKGKALFNDQQEAYNFSGTLQDITVESQIRKQLAVEVIEQKLSRSKVEESEAHLQLLRDAVPAMIFYLDPEQRYKSYNVVFMDWFNVNATEAIGKTTREFIGEAAYEKARPHLERAYAGEQVKYEMYAPSRIDGGKWLSIVYTPHVQNNQVIGVIVHATDVTAHMLALQKSEESELFLNDVFYNSPVAKLVFVGPEMKIERINENMLNILGRDASVVGQTFTEAIPEISATELPERLQHVYATGETFLQPEARIELTRFGKPHTGYYNYIYKALVSAEGEIYGIIVTATDVTGQVVSRQKVEAKEKELRDLIIASPIGICVVSGNPLWVEEVNDRFLLISGKTRTQYDHAPYWEVMQEIAPLFESTLDNVFKTGVKFTSEEHEMVLIRGGIAEKIFATFQYIPIIDMDQQVTKVIIMAIEVTHQVEIRKEIEAAVQARTKELAELNHDLKRSNAELEQFAYIASHDLQEPIRKISTFTQMLERSIGEVDDQSRNYISKIYGSTDRMDKLIRDVLAFSQITQNAKGFEAVALSKIIQAIEVDFEVLISQTGARIETAGLPVVQAIPSQMTQLFSNLLSNSLKYIRPGIPPVIRIIATPVSRETLEQYPQLSAHHSYYHLTFSDNGIGFDPEHADRIFKIFQRLHGKTEFEGTGIGLSICRKIVQSHQGHIFASSGESEGAVFHIFLRG